MRSALIAIAVVITLGRATSAEAQRAAELVIGLYAPSAPFSGPAQRLEFVRALADHVSAQIGRPVIGRVFAASAALASAIRAGDVQFAVIDAPYAAAAGMPYDVLASAVRGGSAVASWQLVVSPGVRSLADLRGKTIAIPIVGTRAGLFVANSLLGGEVEPTYFAKIAEAPDALSAVTMVGAGRAQAALVPSGIELPGGTRPAVTVATIGWPMFVAGPNIDRNTSTQVATAVRSFSSRGPFTGFLGPEAGRYRAIDLGKPNRKGPMAVPAQARLDVRGLLEGRSYTPVLTDVLKQASAEP